MDGGSDSRAGEVMEEGCRKWRIGGRLHTSYTDREDEGANVLQLRTRGFCTWDSYPNRRRKLFQLILARFLAR